MCVSSSGVIAICENGSSWAGSHAALLILLTIWVVARPPGGLRGSPGGAEGLTWGGGRGGGAEGFSHLRGHSAIFPSHK